MRKITIVGAGAVGATAAFAIAESALAEEIVIVDINRDRADGTAWDIAHGIPLIRPVKVYEGSYKDSAESDLTIITVGVPEKVGESRLVPLQKNADILSSIVPQIVKNSPDGLILVVTNPVDILTYITSRIAGLPQGRVLGLGTVLDSSRLCCMLSRDFAVNGRSIQAYMIGEHGDSQVAAFSLAHIAGVSIEAYAAAVKKPLPKDYLEKIRAEVTESAFDVWKKKGSNCYCVADAIKTVAQAILRDERSILPVSSLMTGQYGVENICLSLPSIVGNAGVIQTLELPLTDREKELFQQSGKLLKDYVSQIRF